MIKEMITPVRRTDFDTDAQYKRAMREKTSLLIFVATIIAACWSMYKEHADVEKRKRTLLDKICPQTNYQASKFIEFVNRKAFNYAKNNGGMCCPRCGYWMFPVEQDSHTTSGHYTSDYSISPMKLRFCSMCGELIDRKNRSASELEQIREYLYQDVEPTQQSPEEFLKGVDL